jgi:CO/xanthine dehydrogenase Mo-binding subunit
MKLDLDISRRQYDRTEAYVGAVADVDVNASDRGVRVKRIVVAHDCGLIINPRWTEKPN